MKNKPSAEGVYLKFTVWMCFWNKMCHVHLSIESIRRGAGGVGAKKFPPQKMVGTNSRDGHFKF